MIALSLNLQPKNFLIFLENFFKKIIKKFFFNSIFLFRHWKYHECKTGASVSERIRRRSKKKKKLYNVEEF